MYFNVSFFNIRSIVPHFQALITKIIDENYDVVGLSETWLTPKVDSQILNIKGYEFIRLDRVTRGGGLGIYIKQNISYKLLSSSSTDNLEQMWVEVKLHRNTYVIGCLYRPPKGNIPIFITDLENSLLEFYGFQVICGGDINLDLMDLTNTNVGIFNNTCEAFNLKQVINSPTRLTHTTNTLLDIILIPDNEDNFISGNVDMSCVSDHDLVYCKINNRMKKNDNICTFRNFTNVDTELLSNFLMKAPFEEIIYIHDIEQKVIYLNNILLNIFDVLAPIRHTKASSVSPPWLTYNLRKMIQQKNKAHKKYLHNRTSENWEYFKQIRNATNIATRSEKKAIFNIVS